MTKGCELAAYFYRLIEGFSTAPGVTTVSLTLYNAVVAIRGAPGPIPGSSQRSLAPWQQGGIREIFKDPLEFRLEDLKDFGLVILGCQLRRQARRDVQERVTQ